MAKFDFRRAYKPGLRSDARTFQIALAFVALADGIRLTALGALDFPAWIAVLLVLGLALANRLRDAGRSILLVALPVGVAVVPKAVMALTAITAALYPDFLQFLANQGVDVNDAAAMQAAAYDPATQEAYRVRLQGSPDMLGEIARAGDWPSTWAFWGVVAAFAVVWSRWPSRPHAVSGGTRN